MAANGETPEILFWVGCMGSFDDRARKITKAIAKILSAEIKNPNDIKPEILKDYDLVGFC